MKKYLSIIACLLMLVCMLTGCSKEVTVDATGLVHITLEGETTAMTEKGYTAKLVADEHFDLPETITVVMEGQKDSATYTYDPATGELNIPEVVGAITITGEAAESIVGTWDTTIDFGGIMAEAMGEEEAAAYFDLTGLTVDMTFVFNADGTFSLSADEATVTSMVDNLGAAIKNGMTTMLEDLISQQGLNMSVDTLLAMSGMDLDTMIDQLLAQLDPEELVTSLTADGTYEVREGILYMNGDDEPCAYSIADGVLTLEAPTGVDEEMAKYLFPWALNRVG